jgi:hypothetical protein
MSEHTDDFTAAQQAADAAYAMTMELTGDGAQASDDYKCVMTAYYAKQGKRKVYTNVNGDEHINAEWMAGVWPTLQEIEY